MSHMLKTLPLMVACALTVNVAYASGNLTGAAGHDAGVTLTPTNVPPANAVAKANSAGDIAIGLSSNASGVNGTSNNIAVGTGAKVGQQATAGIALGNNARAHGGANSTNIAIGNNALTGNGQDTQTAGHHNLNAKNAIAIGNNANAAASNYLTGTGVQDGIAIGRNARAQANSVHIGSNDTQSDNSNNRIGVTSVGHNVANEGVAGTIIGYNSKIDVDAAQAGDPRGAASTITGALNTITATDAGKQSNGVAVSVVGSVNQITDSNGVTVMGSGNKITGAYRDETLTPAEALQVMSGDLTPLQGKNLGSVGVIGGGNTVTDSTYASITGTHNTVTNSQDVFLAGRENTITGDVGTETKTIVVGNNHSFSNSTNNIVMGFQDTAAAVTGLSNSTIIGSNYTLTDNVADSVVLGDTTNVSASKAVAVGQGTTVSAEGGVALGQGSVADRAAIAAADAYVPANATTAQTQAVQNTVVGNLGAVSVGNSTGTRQIINVAAGSQDSDAVNVAQLKAAQAQSNTAVSNLDNRVSRVEGNLAEADRDLRAGIAGANALAFLQQPQQAGQSMLSVGVGGYRDATAVAVGLSGNAGSNVSYRLGVGVNNRKDVNWGGSIGYAW